MMGSASSGGGSLPSFARIVHPRSLSSSTMKPARREVSRSPSWSNEEAKIESLNVNGSPRPVIAVAKLEHVVPPNSDHTTSESQVRSYAPPRRIQCGFGPNRRIVQSGDFNPRDTDPGTPPIRGHNKSGNKSGDTIRTFRFLISDPTNPAPYPGTQSYLPLSTFARASAW